MGKVVAGVALAAAIVVTGGAAAGIAISLGGISVAASAGLATYYGVVSALAISSIVNGVVAQLLSSKRPFPPTLTINYAGTVEPRRILYGQSQVDGPSCLPPLS